MAQAVLGSLLNALFSAENTVSRSLGVSVPQLRFALALLASVPVGGGIRLIRNGSGELIANPLLIRPLEAGSGQHTRLRAHKHSHTYAKQCTRMHTNKQMHIHTRTSK